MEMILKTVTKRFFLFVLMSTVFCSCINFDNAHPKYGSNGYDGIAFVKLNWYDREPNYIETGGIVTNAFYWNSYYQSYPGLYTVHFEYDYNNGIKIVTYAYDANVEVWVNKGELGGNNYNGRDGADSYFELALYPNGSYDFTINTSLKSDVIDSLANVIPMGIIDSV